jgi:beta-mannosidase
MPACPDSRPSSRLHRACDLVRRLLPGLALGAAFLAHDAGAQTRTQSLDAGWEFRLAAGDAAAATHPEATSWRAASVPGTVQTDLMAARLLPDPAWRDNESRVQWVGLSDWEYRTTFQVDGATLAREHVALVFDGLDTFAQVRVNGQLVADTDNMFRRWRFAFDGTRRQWLKRGANTLTVTLRSPIRQLLPGVLKQPYALPGAYDSQFGDEPKGVATSSYARKAPYHYGWDWGPRLVALGIWQPVRLESWDVLRIEDFHVRQQRVDAGVAQLSADFEIDATRSGAARLAVQVTPPEGLSFTVTRPVALDAGRNTLSVPIRIEHPARWYPAGYGAQPLYAFHALVIDGADGSGDATGGTVRASADRRTGLRSVELRRDRDQWGRSFEFVINGIPVFAKGANMIPLDSFPNRVTSERQHALLLSARRANMNMLRLWGGGYYESDAFYEDADALGLMIWQDFMFGGAIVPADPAFDENARQEAVEQVKRLRDHPSIVLWCGNNEVQADWESWDATLAFKQKISPDERERLWSSQLKLFGDVLRGVVSRYAPDVPYWATSPGVDLEGPSGQMGDGDLHFWRVWGGSAPVETYLDTTPRFMSEYGLQSYPDMRTIASFTLPEDRRLDSAVIRAHQKFGVAAGPDVGNDRVLFYIRKNYGEPKDFASFVYLSQVMQADGIELAASHLRSQRPRSMGSMYWQLNDVWPGASWSSIDYFGRWKALQFHARRFYADLAVVALRNNNNTNLSLVSDQAVTVDAELRWRAMDVDGRVLRTGRRVVRLAPRSATEVMDLPDSALIGDADPHRALVEFELVSMAAPQERLARSVVYFEPARAMSLPPPGVHPEVHFDGDSGPGNYWIELSADHLARAVWMDFGDLDVELEDNAFDLLPGEHRRIALRSAAPLDRLRSQLSIRTLHDATQR